MLIEAQFYDFKNVYGTRILSLMFHRLSIHKYRTSIDSSNIISKILLLQYARCNLQESFRRYWLFSGVQRTETFTASWTIGLPLHSYAVSAAIGYSNITFQTTKRLVSCSKMHSRAVESSWSVVCRLRKTSAENFHINFLGFSNTFAKIAATQIIAADSVRLKRMRVVCHKLHCLGYSRIWRSAIWMQAY